MRRVLSLAMACGLLGPAAADEVPAVRELSYDGVNLTFEGQKFRTPIRIDSAAHLDKVTTDKASAEAVAKQVNFEKENVIAFAWAGSGQDKLTVVAEKGDKGPLVLFRLVPGRTRDLRQHKHLYAVPKGAEVKEASPLR